MLLIQHLQKEKKRKMREAVLFATLDQRNSEVRWCFADVSEADIHRNLCGASMLGKEVCPLPE